MYDVIIIGAGPAGCFTAYKLAKRKVRGKPVKILILEASKSLKRLKPCGGEVLYRIVQEIPELKKIVVGESKSYIGFYNGKKAGSTKFLEKRVFFTRTSSPIGLDGYLSNMISKKKNVDVKAGQRVTKINVSKDFARVACSNKKEYTGKIVIDASGAMTNFYEQLMNARLKNKHKYFCSVVEFKLSKEDKKKVLGLLEGCNHASRVDSFSTDNIGCHWLFYYDKIDVVNIGCGFAEEKSQRDMLIKYLNFLGLKGWTSKDIHNWIVPIYTPKQLCTDRVLWIGDSVGMANAESGHGIPNILKVSKPLADTCVKALESNNFSKKKLESYQNSEDVEDVLKRSNKYGFWVSVFKFFNKFTPKKLKDLFVLHVLLRHY